MNRSSGRWTADGEYVYDAASLGLDKASLKGRKLLGDGGQGAVYPVDDSWKWSDAPEYVDTSQLVYKEYRKEALKSVDSDALVSMARFWKELDSDGQESLLRWVAWPLAAIVEKGRLSGFVMPRIGPDFFFELWLPSGKAKRDTARFEFLLNNAEFSRPKGVDVGGSQRCELLADLAEALSFMHKRGIAVGDISPNNMLWATTGGVRAFLLDADSMTVRGRSATTQPIKTPNWEAPKSDSVGMASQPVRQANDVYKFALMVVRMLTGSQTLKDPAQLAPSLSGIRTLAEASLSEGPAGRPAAREWIAPLRSAAQANPELPWLDTSAGSGGMPGSSGRRRPQRSRPDHSGDQTSTGSAGRSTGSPARSTGSAGGAGSVGDAGSADGRRRSQQRRPDRGGGRRGSAGGAGSTGRRGVRSSQRKPESRFVRHRSLIVGAGAVCAVVAAIAAFWAISGNGRDDGKVGNGGGGAEPVDTAPVELGPPPLSLLPPTLEIGSVGSDYVALSWEELDGVSSYEVGWRSGSEPGEDAVPKETVPWGDAVGHRVEGLESDTQYWFSVRAMADSLPGEWATVHEKTLPGAVAPVLDRWDDFESNPDSVGDCPEQGEYEPADGGVVEVLSVQSGCLVVEYEPREGRSVEQAREDIIKEWGDRGDVVDVYEPVLYRVEDHSGDAGTPEQWRHDMLNAGAWAGDRGDSPVKVAVIDTGVDTGHRVFGDRVTVVKQGTGDMKHGTMAAGIIAELSGPQVKIKSWDEAVPCPKDPEEPDEPEETCIVYTGALLDITDPKKHGDVKVVNLSLGCRDANDCHPNLWVLERFNVLLKERGMIVVASAGNSYNAATGDVKYRYPVGYEGVVGVAAHARSGALTAYSNRGSYADLSAPSGDCAEYAYDDIKGKGYCGPTRDGIEVPSPGDEFRYTSGGTSAAAPVVTAVIADLWSQFPAPCTPREHILHAVYETAAPQPGLHHDAYGRIQPQAARDWLEANPSPIPVPELKVVDVGVDSVELSWEALGCDVSEYDIRWWSNSGTGDSSVRGAVTRFTVTGLEPGTPYRFQMRARKGSAPGDWNHGVSETTLIPVPELKEIDDSDVGVDYVNLSWGRLDGVSGYEIEWRGGSEPGEGTVHVTAVDGDATGYTVQRLEPEARYWFRVRAKTGSTESEWSETKNAKTTTTTTTTTTPPLPEPTPPPPSSAPTLRVDDFNDKYVALSWNRIEDASGYTIQWGESSKWDAEKSDANFNDRDRTEYTVKGLKPGTEYTFSINAVGSSREPGKTSQTTTLLPTVTVERGDRELDVRWSPPSDDGSSPIKEYELNYRRLSWKDWKTIKELGADQRRDKITGLTNGITYTVRVKARNSVGWGNWSKEVRGTPVGTPGKPTRLTVEAGDGELYVGWSPPSDDGGSPIKEYELNYRPLSGEDWEIIKPGADRRNYTITGLRNHAIYPVKVRAWNGVHWGSWSDTADGIPTPPREVHISRGEKYEGPRCASNNCYYIDVVLRNFPTGVYNIACVHHWDQEAEKTVDKPIVGKSTGKWSASDGIKIWPKISTWGTRQHCWFGPSYWQSGVFVIVGYKSDFTRECSPDDDLVCEGNVRDGKNVDSYKGGIRSSIIYE